MEHHYGAVNINRLSRESGVGLGTVARLKSSDSSIALDKLDKLAAVFGVEPWQLLKPGYSPTESAGAFSPLAADIAKALDAVHDPAAQQRAYALALQVIGLANSPVPASQSNGHAPIPSPTPHQ